MSSSNDYDLDQAAGHALFERQWVSPPASTAASDGLGPYYNATSCDGCHPGGGQGRLIQGNIEIPQALVLHIMSTPAQLLLGKQWQPYAVRGLSAEFEGFELSWLDTRIVYSSGESTLITRPVFSLKQNTNSEISSDTIISARLAPDLHGVANVSGGFGLKATHENLQQQLAAALAFDMGLGNPLFPAAAGDCTPQQQACLDIAELTQTGTAFEPEVSEQLMGLFSVYLEGLSYPTSLPVAASEPGAAIFKQLGCDACHQPELSAGIYSYSDFRTHDMGDDLADRTLLDEPVPTRWRTAPLWSVAERLATSEAAFLHDGRAKTPEEAILWHGGEAQNARDAFVILSVGQRQLLLDYISRL